MIAIGQYQSRPAVLVCLFGLFLRIILSEPVLTALGVDYVSSGGGNPLVKIHPGSYFIVMSFMVLLFQGAQPFAQLRILYQRYRAFMGLVITYCILITYWGLRGPGGVGMLVDTHIIVPIAAIVLSHASADDCKKALNILFVIAVVNSLIGVGEVMTKTRIFTYDPHWSVVREEHFRASALLGHPLNNSMFTSVALFVALTVLRSVRIKVALCALFLVALVAFGGRAGLIFSSLGLAIYGARALFAQAKSASLARLFVLAIGAMIVPIVAGIAFYFLLQVGVGERIAAFGSFDDNSAHTRLLVIHVFDYLSPDDLLFGISSAEVEEIAYRLGLELPLTDIENPWLLMLMLLGIPMFCLWLVSFLLFFGSLMRQSPFALNMAMLAYFFIASTSNSFGRKDGILVIMTAAVICALGVVKAKKWLPGTGSNRRPGD